MLGLVNAETNYYAELRKTNVDVQRALDMNEKYCDQLFVLYDATRDAEEREELYYEINYLIDQARALKIQLNHPEEN